MIRLARPHPFTFRLMVISHGWCDLPPFRWEHEEGRLHAIVPAPGGPLAIQVTGTGEGAPSGPTDRRNLVVRVANGAKPSAADRAAIRRAVSWMFRLDEDFTAFHARCRREKGFASVARHGLGPFLRNPTPFEEFVKVLFTTNVAWSGTRLMTKRLIERYGARARNDPERRAFPTPAAVAAATEKELRGETKVGYRAPYLLEFAERVASGAIDLEAFVGSKEPTDALAKRLGAIKGFGPYAVSSLLLGLGRYDRLILDSWTRPTVAKRRFRGPRVTDRSIERVYASWGPWRSLALWFDCAHESWLGRHVRAEDARARKAKPA